MGRVCPRYGHRGRPLNLIVRNRERSRWRQKSEHATAEPSSLKFSSRTASKSWSVVLAGLRVTRGADKLTLYQWNTKTAKHYFCSVCGIYTHHQRRSNPKQFGINVACLEGVDPFALGEIPVIDGRGSSLVPGERNR